MIVWLASYPRSGNTLFRIILNTVFKIPTYTGFMSDDDLAIDGVKQNITGHENLPLPLQQALEEKAPFFDDGSTRSMQLKSLLDKMDAEEKIYVIKTHSTNNEILNNSYRCILLVRDGRDAAISMAWYVINVHMTVKRAWRDLVSSSSKGSNRALLLFILVKRTWLRLNLIIGRKQSIFRQILAMYVANKDRWSKVSQSWANRAKGKTALVYFDDLVKHPVESVKQAMVELEINISEVDNKVPTFSELKKIHPGFFRQGESGRWKSDFPKAELAVFEGLNHHALNMFGFN